MGIHVPQKTEKCVPLKKNDTFFVVFAGPDVV